MRSLLIVNDEFSDERNAENEVFLQPLFTGTPYENLQIMETDKTKENRDRVLVYFVHPTPHKSRLNSAMLQSLEGLEDVTVRKLYDLYPDFHIDIKTEQRLLVEHDVIVWQHPFYWYSAPPLLKEWIDLVLEHGFAFGHEGNALKGKKVLTVTTTGGRQEAYTEGGRNN
jgi:glutathione-regulated potassium-efflux system ancillary protein KefG